MANVSSEDRKQQVAALGRLGWPLRRIEQATGVRRETAGAYLRLAGIRIRTPGSWGPKKSIELIENDGRRWLQGADGDTEPIIACTL